MRQAVALVHKGGNGHRNIATKGISKALEDIHIALPQRLVVIHQAILLDIVAIAEDKDIGHILILRDNI